MKMLVQKKWMFSALALATVLALAVPSQSYGLNWLSRWWFGNDTEEIQDVMFSAITAGPARLSILEVANFRVANSMRMTFEEVEVAAEVAGGILTFDEIVLSTDTETIIIVIDPTSLTTDVFGSAFRAQANVFVETEDGSTEFQSEVRGRIATRSGEYHLTAALFANSVERTSPGNFVIELLTMSLRGSAAEPEESEEPQEPAAN